MKIRDQIYELVKRRPRTVDELRALIWQIHPQDAPHRDAIKAHVWLLNQSLKGQRVAIERNGNNAHMRGDSPVYRLIDL